ncbi:MAG: hypothetical protein ACJAZO_003087 [Myxococcota bacterium]|jgi:hypothetical protein
MRQYRSGATALEFALILPTFILLLLSVMDFGWLFFQRATLDMAATAGCRAATLVDPGIGDTNMDEVEDVAFDEMAAQLLAGGGGVCETGECYVDLIPYGAPPGRSMICVIGREFEPLIGMTVSPMMLESSIAVRMEWQRWPE